MKFGGVDFPDPVEPAKEKEQPVTGPPESMTFGGVTFRMPDTVASAPTPAPAQTMQFGGTTFTAPEEAGYTSAFPPEQPAEPGPQLTPLGIKLLEAGDRAVTWIEDTAAPIAKVIGPPVQKGLEVLNWWEKNVREPVQAKLETAMWPKTDEMRSVESRIKNIDLELGKMVVPFRAGIGKYVDPKISGITPAQAEALRKEKAELKSQYSQLNVQRLFTDPYAASLKAPERPGDTWLIPGYLSAYEVIDPAEMDTVTMANTVDVMTRKQAGENVTVLDEVVAAAKDYWWLARATPDEIEQYHQESPPIVQLASSMMFDLPGWVADFGIGKAGKLVRIAKATKANRAIGLSEDALRAADLAKAARTKNPLLYPFVMGTESVATVALRDNVSTLNRLYRDTYPSFESMIGPILAHGDDPAVIAKTAGMSQSAAVKRVVYTLKESIGSSDPDDVVRYITDKLSAGRDFEAVLGDIAGDLEKGVMKIYGLADEMPVTGATAAATAGTTAAGTAVPPARFVKKKEFFAKTLRDKSNNVFSIMFMGTNPAYLIRNVSNNTFTIIFDGMNPLVSPETMTHMFERYQGLPLSMKIAFGPASQTYKFKSIYKEALLSTRKATTYKEFLMAAKGEGKFSDLFKPVLHMSAKAETMAAESIAYNALNQYWPQLWEPVVRDAAKELRAAGISEDTIAYLRQRWSRDMNIDEIMISTNDVIAAGTPPGAAGAAVPPGTGTPPGTTPGTTPGTPPPGTGPGTARPTPEEAVIRRGRRAIISADLRQQLQRESPSLLSEFEDMLRMARNQADVDAIQRQFTARLRDTQELTSLRAMANEIDTATNITEYKQWVKRVFDEFEGYFRVYDDETALMWQPEASRTRASSRARWQQHWADMLELQDTTYAEIREHVMQGGARFDVPETTMEALLDNLTQDLAAKQRYTAELRTTWSRSDSARNLAEKDQIWNAWRASKPLVYEGRIQRLQRFWDDPLWTGLGMGPGPSAAAPGPGPVAGAPMPPESASAPLTPDPTTAAVPGPTIPTPVAIAGQPNPLPTHPNATEQWKLHYRTRQKFLDYELVDQQNPNLLQRAREDLSAGRTAAQFDASLTAAERDQLMTALRASGRAQDAKQYYKHVEEFIGGMPSSPGGGGPPPTEAGLSPAQAEQPVPAQPVVEAAPPASAVQPPTTTAPGAATERVMVNTVEGPVPQNPTTYHPIFEVTSNRPTRPRIASDAPYGSPQWIKEVMPDEGSILGAVSITDPATGAQVTMESTAARGHWLESIRRHKNAQSTYDRFIAKAEQHPEVMAVLEDLRDMEMQAWKAWEDSLLTHDSAYTYNVKIGPTDELRQTLDSISMGILYGEHIEDLPLLRQKYAELRKLIDDYGPVAGLASTGWDAVAAEVPDIMSDMQMAIMNGHTYRQWGASLSASNRGRINSAARRAGLPTRAEDFYRHMQQAAGMAADIPPGAMPIRWTPHNPFAVASDSLKRAIKAINARAPRLTDVPTLTPDQITAIQRVQDDILMPRLLNKKLVMDDLMQRVREFSILDYSKRRGINEILQWVFPYNFWYIGTYKNWAQRLVSHPGMVNKYMMTKSMINQVNDKWYKEIMDDPEAEIPEYNSRLLRVGQTGSQYWWDMEKSISPMYNAMYEFAPKEKLEAPGGKLMNFLSEWGPTIYMPITTAIAAYLWKQGYKTAAAQSTGYATPLDRPVKAVTALYKGTGLPGSDMIPAGGWAPSQLISPTVQGGDVWERARVGYFLMRLWMEGEISIEELEWASSQQDDDNWERATQMEAEYRAFPNLLSFATSIALRPYTNTEMYIDKMWKEWGDIWKARETVSADEWQQMVVDFDEDHPWARGVQMSREYDPVARLGDWGYLVLSRLPPGKERTAKLQELGVDELVSKFYDLKGNMRGWPPEEVEALSLAFNQIGKQYNVPTPEMREEFNLAKSNHASIKAQAANLLIEMGYNEAQWVEDIERDYWLTPEDEQPAFLEAHPVLVKYWELQREVTDELKDGTFTEDKYYKTEEQRLERDFWEKLYPPGYNWRKGMTLPPMVEAMFEKETRDSLTPAQLKMATAWLEANVPKAYSDYTEWPMAKQLNENFRDKAAKTFGANIFDLASQYGEMNDAWTKTERNAWIKANEGLYGTLESFWEYKKQYGQQYPLWDKYYGFGPDSGSSSYTSRSSGGYSSYSRSATPLPPTPPTSSVPDPGRANQGPQPVNYDALGAQVATVMDQPEFIALVKKLRGSAFLAKLRKWLSMAPAERAAWIKANRTAWAEIRVFLSWFMRQGQQGSAAADSARIAASVPPSAPIAGA